MATKDADGIERSRAALKAFMDTKGLKPHPWAKAAGLRSSTLYNFIAGRSHSLTSDSLQRLARAAGATVDEILSGITQGPAGKNKQKQLTSPAKTTSQGDVALRWLVGIYGRLFQVEGDVFVQRPVGIPAGVEVVAARVDGDGLHPIPTDWMVFFEANPRPPDRVIGKLCIVRVRGAQQPMIREVRRGSAPGLYTLLSWAASPLENVEVVEAHLVLSITQG